MRWWGWWRPKPPNGEAAKRASKAAAAEFDQAHRQTSQVDETTRRAGELARRTDLFAREIERAMRPRGTA